MVKIRCSKGKWLFTQRECQKAILFLTAIENLSKDETMSLIKSSDIVEEVRRLQPDLRVSWKVIWQLAYCGFIRIRKRLYHRAGKFSIMYYVYSLPKKEKFNLKTLKEDVRNYIKFKEEQGLDDV